MDPYYEDEHEDLFELEQTVVESATGGSFMSFFLGGLFANLFMPRRESTPRLGIPFSSAGGADAERDLSEEQKKFLTHVWSIDEGIRKAEQSGDWVRLYCFICCIREMNDGSWRKFLDEDYAQRDFLMKHMLNLLDYVRGMFPQQRHVKNLPLETLSALERGNLSVDLDTMVFTFDGKPLEEAFPSGTP